MAGQDADPRLGEADLRVVGGKHEVAHGEQAGATPQRGAVDARHERHRQRREGVEQFGDGQRVVQVARLVVVAHPAHPRQVGPGTEGGARAR